MEQLQDDFTKLQPGQSVGDYTLEECLYRSSVREVWQAVQVSVNRGVELEFLVGGGRDAFLENVRAKAMVEDGVMGLVYEVVEADGRVGFAKESISGRSLEEIARAGEWLTPLQVTRLIRTVAGELSNLEEKGFGHERLTMEQIRIGERGTTRMANVAKVGEHSGDESTRRDLAQTLRMVLQMQKPGSTRMQSLLALIEGSAQTPAISWSDAHRLADQVEQQLAQPAASPLKVPQRNHESRKKGGSSFLWLTLFSVGIIAVAAFFITHEKKVEVDVKATCLVPAGRYPRPNGGVVELESFRFDAHEVTIGEYADFLSAIAEMKEEELQQLLPPDLPNEKSNFRPQDWVEVLAAAREKRAWKDRPMTLASPVTGVDWWDAQIYANWKKARLPSAMQWWAAASFATTASESPAWSDVAVVENGKPRGFTGNVSEWLQESSTNPAFPMNPEQPVAAGGSFVRLKAGALSREWLESRSVRRDDLGFRLVYPAGQ